MRDRSVSAGNGPTAAPCPNLPGPYRWLLPAGCGSGGLVDQLKTQAGLSDGVAQEIVRQATTTELAASITRFQYSVIGAPSTVFQSDGSEVRLTRDVDGRLREEQLFETATQLHSRTVHTRNLQGHATRIERFNRSGASLGATIQMWDEEGNLRFRCIEAMANGCSGVAHAAVPPGNPLGGTAESFWYDREGRLILEMDPEVAYTEYQLDERGWVTGISQTAPGAPPIPAEIGRHTRFVLNDDGQWTERSQHQLATPLPPFITRELRSFDGFGRVTSVTDSEGKVSVVRHTRQDALSSVSTASAWTVQYVRDHFSRVRERRLNGQTTVTVFRLPGGQVFRRNVTGAVERFLTYDEFGAPVFERQGPVTTVQVKPADRRYRGGSTVRLETRLATTSTEQTLDALGEVLSEVETGFDGTSTPPTRSSSFLRDDNGFLRQTTDSLGAVSEFVPNFLGWVGTQIVTVNPGVTRTTSFTYNRRGQLLTRSDPRGGQPQTVQTYTGYGEPKTRTVPGGTTAAPNDVTASWQYDVVGRLTREQMGTAVVRYQYANDRLSQVTADNGTTVLRSFGYDTLGRISSATHFNVGLTPWVAANQRTVVATRTYDPVYGRLATESTKVGNRPTRTTGSAWSLVSDRWRRTVTRPDGLTSVENFDGLGRLGTMQRAFGGLNSQYTYTGELEEVEDHQTTGASFGRQVTWDGLGQLQRSTYSQGGIVSDVRYQRDREGRIVSQNRLLRQGTTQDRTFRGYKYQQGGALEQLIEAVGNATPSGAATDTTWASVQAAGASLSGQRFEYTRDVEGSPLQVLRVDVGGQLPRFTSPTRRRGFQMENFRLDGSAVQAVTHDTAGRMTQEFGRTYSWDEFHSLVRAGAASGSNAQAFQYDAFGRLVAVRRGTTNWPIEEELAYDGTQMVAAWNFEETQLWNAQWGQGVDNLVSVRMGTTGTEAFALKDGRGNVTGYYRGQGSTPGLWVTAEYTPEGRVTQKDWTTSGTCTETGLTKCPRMGGVPFGFHSAYKSPAHGLLYFRNRWYSAEAGQWLSQDPLGEVDSANLYAFNGFDSVNFIDPLGLNKGPSGIAMVSTGSGGEPAPSVIRLGGVPSPGTSGPDKGGSTPDPSMPDLSDAMGRASDNVSVRRAPLRLALSSAGPWA
jgi:RHS repeat-associated protein